MKIQLKNKEKRLKMQLQKLVTTEARDEMEKIIKREQEISRDDLI